MHARTCLVDRVLSGRSASCSSAAPCPHRRQPRSERSVGAHAAPGRPSRPGAKASGPPSKRAGAAGPAKGAFRGKPAPPPAPPQQRQPPPQPPSGGGRSGGEASAAGAAAAARPRLSLKLPRPAGSSSSGSAPPPPAPLSRPTSAVGMLASAGPSGGSAGVRQQWRGPASAAPYATALPPPPTAGPAGARGAAAPPPAAAATAAFPASPSLANRLRNLNARSATFAPAQPEEEVADAGHEADTDDDDEDGFLGEEGARAAGQAVGLESQEAAAPGTSGEGGGDAGAGEAAAADGERQVGEEEGAGAGAEAEGLGSDGEEQFPEMQFSLPTPTKVKVKAAEYMQSCVTVAACPPPRLPEFAVIGRSNVGKSSLINMLTGRRDLALVSKEPGKTKCINHFLINDNWFLVDLPGYGFAKIGQQGRLQFDAFTREYFSTRPNLAMVLLLVDASIPPQPIDLEYANWLTDSQVPFTLVFTKADKRRKGLTPAVLDSHVTAFKRALLRDLAFLPPSLLTSAARGLGRGELLNFLAGLRVAYERSGRLEAIRQGMI